MENKEVNKSWTCEFKGTHVELKWRDYTVLLDKEDFHYFKENVFRIIGGSKKFPFAIS